MKSFRNFVAEVFDYAPAAGGLRKNKIRSSPGDYDDTKDYNLGHGIALSIETHYHPHHSISLKNTRAGGDESYYGHVTHNGSIRASVHKKAIIALHHHVKTNPPKFVEFEAANERMAPAFTAILHSVLKAHGKFACQHLSGQGLATSIGDHNSSSKEIFSKATEIMNRHSNAGSYTHGFRFKRLED